MCPVPLSGAVVRCSSPTQLSGAGRRCTTQLSDTDVRYGCPLRIDVNVLVEDP